MTDSTRDEHWMNLALAQARDAAAAGEVPVGAVVVKDDHLIATGRNAPIHGHDPTAHAEIVALREAARTLGNYRLDGCTLYVTLEPCAMCSGAMLHARLTRVVFGAPDPRTGAAGSVLNLFAQAQINHQTQVHGGVCAEACGQLLRDFFRPRRANTSPLREDALRTPDSAFAHAPDMPGQSVWLSDLPSLQGLRLHVLDTGPAEATEATLWLHGPDSWSLAWREAVLEAPAGRHIVPDLIGFGRSDKPKKEAFHTLATHARILDELCDRLGLRWVGLTGTPEIQVLLQLLSSLQPQRYRLAAARQATALSAVWRDAPYPDKGHRAGPLALSRLL
ncbi:MAG: tRNA adenosine(34) deaminase TadA [Limnohabitans sp.]